MLLLYLLNDLTENCIQSDERYLLATTPFPCFLVQLGGARKKPEPVSCMLMRPGFLGLLVKSAKYPI